ncbi:ABC transporter ATP-binding protein [Pseudokineococcus marinus]|uniref:ABC transporter ATP-binding protein n=1 Tax=Pseudokineococcus marinus TaxID=351215 RepID=A0A849BMG7_9ACTN|nr:ABC transporter ATP-binding protein [Pseudokineococcus marinus]NNH22565.1 ABC transporter ATP-binding protein [Pseudokineococcus marinus]
MTTTDPAVSVRGVGRRLGGVQALQDVSFDLPAGAVCGLLGRNGAGKTTLMAVVAGHDRPDAGEVAVHGERPFENPAAAGLVSMVRDDQRYPDDFHLAHLLRVGPLFHAGWDAQLAEEVVDVFRIPAKPQLRKLSRGQSSAVGILVGLASRAPVTVLDEPTLGLDAPSRQAFADLLVRDLAARPRTVLVATHLADELEGLLDRVLVLDGGRLVRDAALEDLQGSASVVLGPVEAVERATADVGVLASRRVGGFLERVVEEPGGSARAAEDPALQVRRAGLQELVAALGAGPGPAATPRPDRLTEVSR